MPPGTQESRPVCASWNKRRYLRLKLEAKRTTEALQKSEWRQSDETILLRELYAFGMWRSLVTIWSSHTSALVPKIPSSTVEATWRTRERLCPGGLCRWM